MLWPCVLGETDALGCSLGGGQPLGLGLEPRVWDGREGSQGRGRAKLPSHGEEPTSLSGESSLQAIR